MNKSFFKYTLQAFFTLVLISGTALAQTVKVEASLQDYTIKIGDQTKLFLIVSQPAGQRVIFPKFQDTITKQIQIVSTNKRDTVVDQQDKNRITVTQGYILTSFDAGIHNFPALSFGTTGGVIKANDLTLQVQTVKIDTTKAIFDIKKPIVVTYTLVDWIKDNWAWILLALFAIAAIIVLIYYLRKRSKIEPVTEIKKPSIPAHVTAINKLNELRAKKLWQQELVKEYHSELTDIIREYLEQRYQIKTYEKTTDEILQSLKNRDINTENLSSLQQLLTLADLAKFAKLAPLPIENEESMENAIAFVSKTRLADKPSATTNTVGGSGNGTV